MYEGYLLRIGGSVLPMEYILEKTYKINPNRRQDLDPFRDANGVLHRNVIAHRPSTVQVQIRRPTNVIMDNVNSILQANYINEAERKVILTYYCPDIKGYQSGEFYIPNIEYTIDHINGNVVYYGELTLEFIEY